MRKRGAFGRHFWALPPEAAMLAGVLATIQAGDYFHTLTSIFTFSVSFVPFAFERLFKVRLPANYHVIWVGFVFLSMFCGEVLRFYATIRGWDAGMHAFSGMAAAFGAILWLRTLLRRKKIRLPFSLQLLFAFSISIMVAVLWEIVEFGSDQLFGTSSQDHSLHDTMTDLVCQTIGAAALIILYDAHAKGRRIVGMRQAINQFERLNP